jgi:hypothetical protein
MNAYYFSAVRKFLIIYGGGIGGTGNRRGTGA